MKLVQKAELVKPQGAKVMRFELSLLDLGGDRYVVNYRQGLAGGSTYEGTVTLRPLSRLDANRAFDRTLEQKRREGYEQLIDGPAPPPAGATPPAKTAPPAGAAPPATTPPTAAPAARPARARGPGADPRTQADRYRASVASRLREYATRPRLRPEDERGVGFLLKAAAQTRLTNVEPALLALMKGAPPARAALAAYALGRNGSMASVSALGALYGDAKAPPHARHAAAEALLALSGDKARAEFRDALRGELPQPLRDLCPEGDPEAFRLALSRHLQQGGPDAHGIVARLYLLGDPAPRPALLEYARTMALSPPSFRQLRRLYRAAEFRRDAELFGVISHRFEVAEPNFQGGRGPDAAAKAGSRAFGQATRTYLRRSTWRLLRRLGTLGEEAFVPVAVGVLLPYSDDDAEGERSHSYYDYNTRKTNTLKYGGFSSYYSLNRLLFKNSKRVYLRERLEHATWGDGPRVPGEEAFPRAWKARPQGLLHLLDESQCGIVHEFAALALSECTSFCDALDLEVLKMLLGKPYEPTARLGFQLASKRLDPSNPDTDLLVVMATCAHTPARHHAHELLLAHAERMAQRTAVLSELILARYPDAQGMARKLIGRVRLNEPTTRVLLGRTLAGLLSLGEHDGVRAEAAGKTLFELFPRLMSELGPKAISDLLAHPLLEVQLIGADVAILAPELPSDELIQRLLESPHDALLQKGARLLQRLPAPVLLERPLTTARMLTSKSDVLRREGYALARSLVQASPAFAPALASLLLDALLRNKLPEGVADSVRKLLLEDFAAQLAQIEGDRLLRLIESKSPQAQYIAGYLLQSRDMSGQFSVDVLARLGDSETAMVREAAWKMLGASVDRVKADMPGAIRVLDSPWDDTREWAFTFFKTGFSQADFTVDVLVSICDSIRPDVEAFGRELLSMHFRDEDGPTLMLRLSEHPSPAAQLMVTNYLDRFASKSPERIRGLMPYFSAVLGRVNKGRVAKIRVLEFLRAEAVASEEVAEEVLPLLHRITASIAVQARAACLEAIAAIGRAHPSLQAPVPTLKPEARHGVRVRLPG